MSESSINLSQTASVIEARTRWWLFTPAVDLSVFLGSAIVAVFALFVGARFGVSETPDWTWIWAILLIDVAHVWATAFRVYLDPAEVRRRLALYLLTPIIGLSLGIALYSESDIWFWRTLAYLAVFHFVRQQYGWVALYRARMNERGQLGKWIDTIAVYMATLYPLAYWHTNLPREFWWFLKDDFAPLPTLVERVLWPVYCLSLAVYFARSLYRWLIKREINPGKDIVVGTTALCWYLGIVALNSDYAFAVTNVIIHGVPYLALVYFYARRRREESNRVYRLLARSPLIFLASLWVFAFVEELFWHRSVWHERTWLFGGAWDSLAEIKFIIVPLLALPQLTHYLLDGFIWRRRGNPDLRLSD
jgi:hypothetical protein